MIENSSAATKNLRHLEKFARFVITVLRNKKRSPNNQFASALEFIKQLGHEFRNDVIDVKA